MADSVPQFLSIESPLRKTPDADATAATAPTDPDRIRISRSLKCIAIASYSFQSSKLPGVTVGEEAGVELGISRVMSASSQR